MTKKELKQQQATFHAFIKSQQKPEIEANIIFMEGEEERVIPVKIKQRLNIEEEITLVNRAVGFCKNADTNEIFPSNLGFGMKIAIIEAFTDIEKRIKPQDMILFAECFDVITFIYENLALDACREEDLMTDKFCADIRRYEKMCQAELEWAQKQCLNTQGVNGVFVKLNNLIDKIDASMDAMGGYMDRDKVEELLNAVKTVAEAPEKVSAKIIEIERAYIEETEAVEENV